MRRSRLRENSSWVQQEKIAPGLGKVYAWVRARRLAEYDLTYTRQLKLAELREARINIRQDRV